MPELPSPPQSQYKAVRGDVEADPFSGEMHIVGAKEWLLDITGTLTDYVLPEGVKNGDLLSFRLTGNVTLNSIVPPVQGFWCRLGVRDQSGGNFSLTIKDTLEAAAGTAIYRFNTPGSTFGDANPDDFVIQSEEGWCTIVYASLSKRWKIMTTTSTTGGGGGGTPGWDDVLAVDAHSGANNPIVDTSQFIQFGTSAPTQVTGQIRSNSNFLIHTDVGIEVQAHDDIYIHGPDIILLESTGGSQVRLLSSASVKLESTGSDVLLEASTYVDIVNGFLRMQEQAASTPSMAAGKALYWVRNDTPNRPMFTDDTNVDARIALLPLPLTDLATQAADTFLGNFTGSPATPTALAGSTVAGGGLTYTTGGILAVGAGTGITVNANDVQLSALTAETFFGNFTAGSAVGTARAGTSVAGAGLTYTAGGTIDVGSSTSIVVGASDIQRAAITGDVTAAQNVNATAFRSFGAKSVLANATNAGAVPSDLAGSAAFQHLRVNSANTGLEWSILTAGDFPASVVPLSAFPTQAAGTFLANITAGTAVPTAHPLATFAGAGLVYTNVTGVLDVVAGVGASLVVGAGDVQRGALTGAITAAQDSNTTAFGVLAAKSVLANATNASAVPAALAGSAAFQHLRVNSANNALEWSVLTAGDFPAGVVPLTGLATQAAETFLGNFTAGTASPTALAGSTVAGGGLTYTTGGILAVGAGTGITVNANDVQLAALAAETFFGNFTAGSAVGAAVAGSTVAGAGLTYTTGGILAVGGSTSIIVGANDVQHAALTGDVTAAQNVNATAFRSFGAKSVLANATNTGAVPSDLAGSAAFQHLRVNSANTGLEWSIFTSGDFPAGVIPLSAFPTQAAGTFLANITAGTAVPTAHPLATFAGAGLVYTNVTGVLDVVAGAGASIVVAAGDIQRGALTGAITASQDSNTTAFGVLAAKSVLANATNASAVPAALAGSAAFQHLRVNSANTALEWSVLTAGDFPAGVVPLTGLATQAAETFTGNFTAGTASPTALAGSTVAGGGLTYTTGGILAVGAGTGLTVNANDVAVTNPLTTGVKGDIDVVNAANDWQIVAQAVGNNELANMAANSVKANPTGVSAIAQDFAIAADNVPARVGGNLVSHPWSTLAGGGLTYSAGVIDVGSSTSIIVGASDIQRAALTGPITAAQNSNATSIAASVGGASLDVTSNVLDYVGTTSEIVVTGTSGNLGTINIAALECGGSVRFTAMTGAFQVEGFTARSEGFWFEVVTQNSELQTFSNEDATATAADRIRVSGNSDAIGTGLQGCVYYKQARWRAVFGGADTRVISFHYAAAADASISITPPTGATWFEFEIIGGGAGGGGADADSIKESCAGGGGGAAEWRRGIRTITTGNVTGAIGGGGAGGVNTGGNGTAGGSTTLTYDAVSTIAAGGQGTGNGSSNGPTANSQFNTTPGAPGGGTTATTTEGTAGGDGFPGMTFSVSANNDAACGGNGGASVRGSGGRGGSTNIDSGSANGSNGIAPGSGGGGAARTSDGVGATTGATGGTGAAGSMKVTFYSGPVPALTAIT